MQQPSSIAAGAVASVPSGGPANVIAAVAHRGTSGRPSSALTISPASSLASPLPAALTGTIAIGAVLGLGGVRGVAHTGALDVVHAAAVLPAILLGVTAAMIPALYIATSLTGAAPPARQVGAAIGRAFRACGLAFFGLLAPVAFLLATSDSHRIAPLLGALVISVGVFSGLRVLFDDLFGQLLSKASVRLVFVIWAAVSLAIGASMYGQFMVG